MPRHGSVNNRGFLGVVSVITFILIVAIIDVSVSQEVAGRTPLLQPGFLVASLILVLMHGSDLCD